MEFFDEQLQTRASERWKLGFILANNLILLGDKKAQYKAILDLNDN